MRGKFLRQDNFKNGPRNNSWIECKFHKREGPEKQGTQYQNDLKVENFITCSNPETSIPLSKMDGEK